MDPSLSWSKKPMMNNVGILTFPSSSELGHQTSSGSLWSMFSASSDGSHFPWITKPPLHEVIQIISTLEEPILSTTHLFPSLSQVRNNHAPALLAFVSS